METIRSRNSGCCCTPNFGKKVCNREYEKRAFSACNMKCRKKQPKNNFTITVSSETYVPPKMKKKSREKVKLNCNCCNSSKRASRCLNLEPDIKKSCNEIGKFKKRSKDIARFNCACDLARKSNRLNLQPNESDEVEQLKKVNQWLVNVIKNKKSLKNVSIENILNTKLYLDEYQEKLETLYEEFMETSEMMEKSKGKICHCISSSQDKYEELKATKKRLSKLLQNTRTKYVKLLKEFNKSKENEVKFKQENCCLRCHSATVESQLQALNKSRKETTMRVDELENEIQRKISKLRMKSKRIKDLEGMVEKLKAGKCQCKGKSDQLLKTYKDLQGKYENVVAELKCYKHNYKARCKEVETLKAYTNTLLFQLSNAKSASRDLANATNEQYLSLSKLNNLNQEKDSIIQMQKSDLQSKDKHIELLEKNLEKLRQKVVNLQEELVSLTVSSQTNKNKNSTTLYAEDCCDNLTQELDDLITALLQEIDKSVIKDEQIKQQEQEICCLRCNLATNEEQLAKIRKELKVLRKELTSTLRDKEDLTTYLKCGC